uniref:Uncharacterized protein n=1 Tax=Caenorhabditis tropicalis TaxID=1561998 RepID=A0A1I7UQK7_9PELO
MKKKKKKKKGKRRRRSQMKLLGDGRRRLRNRYGALRDASDGLTSRNKIEIRRQCPSRGASAAKARRDKCCRWPISQISLYTHTTILSFVFSLYIYKCASPGREEVL